MLFERGEGRVQQGMGGGGGGTAQVGRGILWNLEGGKGVGQQGMRMGIEEAAARLVQSEPEFQY